MLRSDVIEDLIFNMPLTPVQKEPGSSDFG